MDRNCPETDNYVPFEVSLKEESLIQYDLRKSNPG